MFAKYVLGALSALAFSVGMAGSPVAAAELNDDGLHHQPWFLNSFMDLNDDLKEASAAGKRFAIFWEQKGCPYCRDMHVINLADKKVEDYVKDNFVVLQLNLWGDREVTDFDGEVTTEKKLAQKYGVNFTPTVQFFPEDIADAKGKTGMAAEVARMPGYFRPFHFISMFEYVHEKRYAKGQEFQRYILEKVAAEQAKGNERPALQ